MTLLSFMTATATTQRRGAPNATTGKTGAHATYLENVKVTPVMLTSQKGTGAQSARGIPGVDGIAAYQYETYTESHAHTKESNPVTELPDIRENDRITIDSITYVVRRAAIDTATTSFGETLYIYLDKDNV